MKRKTSVRSYERKDGTKVSAHDRTIDASDIPKTSAGSYVKPPRNSDVDLSPREYKGVKVYFNRLDYGDIQARFYNDDKGVWEATYEPSVDQAFRATKERIDEVVFVPQGFYVIGNGGGFEVQLSDDGEKARMRDAFGGKERMVSEWLDIEYVQSDDPEEEFIAVIDPYGYNIPLDKVERVE
jgi:hypothetical protein